MARRPPDRESLAADPSVVLLPLWAFLGVTFLFAGLQKLANPNFFRAASPISIHAQLVAAGRTSPIKGLLHHLVSVSTLLGLLIALAEVAIGLGVLAGVMTRVAAVGGMLLSFGLFLTVSFHSSPYYTGADIVFVFAFTPLLIAGAGRLTAVEGVRWLAQRYEARNLDALAVDEERRKLIVAGSLAAAGLLLAGLAAGLGRLAGGHSRRGRAQICRRLDLDDGQIAPVDAHDDVLGNHPHHAPKRRIEGHQDRSCFRRPGG